MKKIFTSLFFVLAFSLIFSNISFAQTNGGITVATVNVSNAKIVSQKDRDFVVSFDITNKIGVQPQVKYSVRLTQILSKNEYTVDQKVYEDIFSLGENTTVSKTIEYSIPNSLQAGTYRLWIDSKNQNGLTFGVAFLGEVKILDNKSNFIEIIPGSCSFFAGIGQTSLSQGSAIGPSSELTAKCKVKSNFPSDIIFKPSFVTRSQTVFGNEASTTGSSTEKILIKNGTNDISLTIPKGLKPQTYNLTFSLISEDSKIISNVISFNYVLSGQSGTIQNVVFDKTYYRAGDTANLQIFSTQPGTSVIVGLVSSGDGESCTATTSRQISSFSIINLALPIIKDCNNPKANITILAGDKVLDSNNFQVMTVSTPTNPMVANGNGAVTIVVIFLILIFGVVIYKRKYFNINMFILAFFFSFIIFGSNVIPVFAAVNISASSTLVSYGASTNISWSAANNDRCSITRSDSGTIWQNSVISSFALISQLNGFTQPSGLGVDSANNLYVVDTYNNRIQKFNSAGIYLSSINPTAISGGGAFNHPVAIAIDSSDNIYVTDTENYRVKKFNSQGVFLLQFGTNGSGNGQFNLPSGIAVDSLGNVYVADTYNYRIQKFNSNGVYQSKFGSFGSVDGTFWYPNGVAVDSSGYIYVADSHDRVDVFNSSGVYLTKFGGSNGNGLGLFDDPFAIAFSKTFYYHNNNNESLFVVDDFDWNFQTISSYGTFQLLLGGFTGSKGIVIDNNDYLYVSSNVVQKFAIISSGSKSSGPLTTTTTFTATCLPSYNTSSVTVSVLPPSPVIILTPALNPVPYNGSTTISWTASGDISSGCSLSGNGSTTVWPSNVNSASISSGPLTATTTFSLTCTGLGGTATKDLVMSVLPPPGPVMTLSSVFPVPYNGSTTVSWTAINSSSCTLYKDNISLGAVNPVSGSTSTGNMITNATYLLSCSGIGGSATTSPLTVIVLAPMSIGISASPNPVPANTNTAVSFSSTGANYCNLTKNSVLVYSFTYSNVSTTTVTNVVVVNTGGAGITSGVGLGGGPSPYYTQISTTTDFTVTCNNSSNSTSTSVIVEPIIPLTVNLNASPAYVPLGSSTIISWDSTGANSCIIKENGLDFATGISGSQSSGPTGVMTTFTATCINNSASTTRSLVVVTDPNVEGTTTPIVISLVSNSTSTLLGSPVMITWSAPTASSCELTSSDPGWHASGISGSKLSNPITATTTFSAVCTNSYAPSKITYNYNGTYIVPDGVNPITVEVWGGGASGVPTINGGGAGGGGGGGYGKQTFNDIHPGDSYAITVGNGGNQDIVGHSGETSSFGNIISATGGSTGSGTSGGAGGVSTALINARGVSGSPGHVGRGRYTQIVYLKPGVPTSIPLYDASYGGAGGAGGSFGSAVGGAGGAGGGECFSSCHGSPGTAPGGAGGGAGSGMGWNWGGTGAKGEVVIYPSGGTYTNSQSKSITVGVFTQPNSPKILNFDANPTPVSSGSSTALHLDFIGADSCTITGTNGDSFTTSYSPDYINSSPLTADTTFTAVCSNLSLSTSTTASVTVNVVNPTQPELPAGSVVSTCVASQGTSTALYVNRTTKWTAILNTTSTSTPIIQGTNWVGTNIAQTGILSGLIYNKIYTTIGLKNITGVTTGTLDGKPFISVCSASTTIEWNPGTGGEI